jgi:diguanylate cyclase (GGDEF)-like protein
MNCELKTDHEESRIRALERLEVLDTDLEAPFENIISLIEQVMQVPICAVSFVDRNRQWFKAQRGLDVGETPRNISFCTHAIQQSKPLIIRNALEDLRFRTSPLVVGAPFIRSYAGIPLKVLEGYCIGSLCAIDTKPRDFQEHEITILEHFAKLVVSELELRLIASTDHLTGALTRRAWSEGAKVEMNRALRYKRPLSLAVLDIDKFKLINDTYGHSAGDAVIKTIAGLCMENMRKSDFFGRLGGEEFALLMPETDGNEALSVMERMRWLITDTAVNVGEDVNITASIGVTQLGESEKQLDTFLERADKALYQAKKTGRNRTIVV